MFIIIGGDGREYGPVSVDQIRQWIRENRANLDTRVKRVGTESWQTVRELPEFAAAPALAGVGAGPAMDPASAGVAHAAGFPGATAAAPSPTEQLQFTGNWKEYFKIWIVNVLLTIVTLGIYAAWAKVRKRRYFYANTRVFGHTFEYLADPKKIFYGNMIVGGSFLIFSLIAQFAEPLASIIVIAFFFLVPWLITRALSFNARNSAWRGLRFSFTGRYGGAASAFIGWPLLTPLTLGILHPFVVMKQREFIVDHHAYGTTPFSLQVLAGDFYRIFGKTALFFLPLALGFPAILIPIPFLSTILFVVGGPLALAGVFYLRAQLFNYCWNNTTLGNIRFIASMSAGQLFVIHLVNTLVTVLTLGLMYPWAEIRMTKYRLECLEVQPGGNMDEFVAATQPPVGALGEAADDFFDFDIGL